MFNKNFKKLLPFGNESSVSVVNDRLLFSKVKAGNVVCSAYVSAVRSDDSDGNEIGNLCEVFKSG